MNRIKRGDLVLASGNPAKLEELQALLHEESFQVRLLKDIVGSVEIDESGQTLEQNAEIKARFARKHSGLSVLADDTGLEVDALNGRPGVWSARYAGPDSNDLRNRQKLLGEMRHIVEHGRRTARFRTVLVYISDSGIWKFEGYCEGVILQEERGSGGFGYDPLFQPKGYLKTFAEMDPDEKNRISHRGQALQKFLRHIRESQ